MRLFRHYRASQEFFNEETWRLEISVRAFGELGTADPSAGQQLLSVPYQEWGGLRNVSVSFGPDT